MGAANNGSGNKIPVHTYDLDRKKSIQFQTNHSDITTYSHRLSFATFMYETSLTIFSFQTQQIELRLVAIKSAFLSH